MSAADCEMYLDLIVPFHEDDRVEADGFGFGTVVFCGPHHVSMLAIVVVLLHFYRCFFSWKKGRGSPLNVSLTVPLLLQRVLPSAGRKVEIKERCSQARQEGKGNAHQNGHSRRRTLGKNAYFFTLRAHGKRYITFTFFGFFFFI